MRLKEDSSSYNAIGLKKRYAQAKPGWKGRKNTRVWCRGKVGVEHDYEKMTPRNIHCTFTKYDVCKNCGKQNTRNATYYCRYHETWDSKLYWNDKHVHTV